MRLSIVLFVFLILGACASQPGPAPMRIGNEVAFEMLQDQYSNPFPHEDNMQVLLFADDMQPSRDVRDAMGRVAADCYEQGRLVFVACQRHAPFDHTLDCTAEDAWLWFPHLAGL